MSEVARLGGPVVVLTALLAVSLAAHLLYTRLHKVYRYFFVFLCFYLFRFVFICFVPLSRRQYTDFYIITEIIQWIVYVMVTLEIYNHVFARFIGILSLSRWVMTTAMTVSLLLTALSLQPDVTAKSENLALDYLLIVERGVLSGLSFLIVLMSLFLAWFPVSLPRNVVTHTVLFAAYFLAKASVLLLRNVSSTYASKSFNQAIAGFGVVCMLLWIARLRPQGEKVTVVVGHPGSQPESQLIRQLEHVNAMLARAGRE